MLNRFRSSTWPFSIAQYGEITESTSASTKNHHCVAYLSGCQHSCTQQRPGTVQVDVVVVDTCTAKMLRNVGWWIE